MSDDIRAFFERMAGEAGRSGPGVPRGMLRRAARRRARSALVLGAAGAILGYGAFAGVQAIGRPTAHAPAATRQCEWAPVPSPNRDPDHLDNRLDAVAALSDDDVWAVGVSYENQEGGQNWPLAMHWDGSSWTISEIPDSYGHEGLLDVDGTAPDDVWTVGLGHDALHWDGGQWQTVPLADPGTTYWHVQTLSAVAPDDVWAAGNAGGDGEGGALIEHWDGTSWHVEQLERFSPQPLTGQPYATLAGIDARSDEVWSVGELGNTAPVGESNTFALHLAGSGWSRTPTPDVPAADGKSYGHLLSVGEIAPDDAWAVGIAANQPGIFGGGDRALIEHWDGDRWTVAETRPADSRLVKVLAVSAHDVWAVGSTGYSGTFKPLVLRWDGSGWNDVSVDVAGQAWLSDISEDPSGHLWAVGLSVQNDHGRSLVLRCS